MFKVTAQNIAQNTDGVTISLLEGAVRYSDGKLLLTLPAEAGAAHNETYDGQVILYWPEAKFSIAESTKILNNIKEALHVLRLDVIYSLR